MFRTNRKILIAMALLSLAACARPQRVVDHADWLKEATRVWPGETKARVIAAAEAVVKHADPQDTKLEYSQRGFIARRKFFVYAVLATASGQDTWSFSASENSEGASASVRIIQRGTAQAGQYSERFRDNQTMVGSLRLFYARIDYLLGKRKDWITCSAAPEKLGLPKDSAGLESLCSLTHQGRDASPPVLAQPKARAKEAPKGPPPPPPIPDDEANG